MSYPVSGFCDDFGLFSGNAASPFPCSEQVPHAFLGIVDEDSNINRLLKDELLPSANAVLRASNNAPDFNFNVNRLKICNIKQPTDKELPELIATSLRIVGTDRLVSSELVDNCGRRLVCYYPDPEPIENTSTGNNEDDAEIIYVEETQEPLNESSLAMLMLMKEDPIEDTDNVKHSEQQYLPMKEENPLLDQQSPPLDQLSTLQEQQCTVQDQKNFPLDQQSILQDQDSLSMDQKGTLQDQQSTLQEQQCALQEQQSPLQEPQPEMYIPDNLPAACWDILKRYSELKDKPLNVPVLKSSSRKNRRKQQMVSMFKSSWFKNIEHTVEWGS